MHLSLAARADDPDERALHLGRGTTEPSEDVAARARGGRRSARSPGCAGDSGRPRRARRGAHTARTIRAVAPTAAQGLGSLPGGGRGRRPRAPAARTASPARSPPGPDRARVLVRLGWLGAQQDTMPLSESIAYQEQALAEADGGGRRDRRRPRRARATPRHQRRLPRGARPRGAAPRGGGETAAANLMFPSPAGELATARFFAGEGLDEALFQDGDRARGGDRADRRAVPEPEAPARARAALHRTARTRPARLLLELLELSTELGRIRSIAGCVLHLTELELRAGDVAQAEAHAREFATSTASCAATSARSGIRAAWSRCTSVGSRTHAGSCGRGPRTRAASESAYLARAPPRGARPPRARRSGTSPRRGQPAVSLSDAAAGTRDSASGRCTRSTPMRSRRSSGSASSTRRTTLQRRARGVRSSARPPVGARDRGTLGGAASRLRAATSTTPSRRRERALAEHERLEWPLEHGSHAPRHRRDPAPARSPTRRGGDGSMRQRDLRRRSATHSGWRAREDGATAARRPAPIGRRVSRRPRRASPRWRAEGLRNARDRRSPLSSPRRRSRRRSPASTASSVSALAPSSPDARFERVTVNVAVPDDRRRPYVDERASSGSAQATG